MEPNSQFIRWVNKIGTTKAAQLLGVTPNAVRHWRNGVRSISLQKAKEVERVTAGAITRQMLRPDLYD